MHSSRMRTARSGCTCPRGVYLPGGCNCWGVRARGMYLLRGTSPGVPARGVYLPRGVYLHRGVHLPRGMYLPGGVPDGSVPAQGHVPARGCTCPGGLPAQGMYLPRGVPAPVLPPMNRLTDRCNNITLPQTSFAAGNKGKSAV